MAIFCCFSNGSDSDGDDSPSQTNKLDYPSDGSVMADWNLNNDEGEGYQATLWQHVVASKSRELAAVRARQQNSSSKSKPDILDAADDVSADRFLQSLTTLYAQNGVAQRMPRVREIFTSIQPFVTAVNTLVQSYPAATLVWGSLCLVFQSVIHYASFWDDLRVMFQDLGRSLPRFHGYIQVLHTPRLHDALRSVYSKFLDICMMTLDCLQSNQCFMILRIQWSKFAADFKNASAELSTINADFDKEAQFAHVQESSRRHDELLDAMQRTKSSRGLTTNINIPRNGKFTGRDDTLAQIHANLEPGFKGETNTRSLSSCLIYAIGGMGKTETALEYTYRFREYYTYVFWLPSETQTALQDAFLDVASKLGVAKGSEAKISRIIELTLEWFRTSEEPWLLVFDNVENPADIQRFWPAATGGSIIVTSQNPELGHLTTHSILLPPMPPKEGCSLIQAYLNRGKSEQESSEELSNSLGGLPLAIVHFTGYIAKSNCPVQQISQSFTRQLRTVNNEKMSASIPSSRSYEHTLSTVWNLAFNRLSKDAMTILEYIAFLDPDDIPVCLFIGDADNEERTTSEWIYWSIERFNEAVGVLCERHLVSRNVQEDSDSLRTHRALQMSILQRLHDNPAKLMDRFNIAVAIVRKAVPVVNIVKRSDASQFARFAKFMSQVTSLHSVFTKSEGKIDGSIGLASLLDDTGYYAFIQSNNTSALAFAETGRKICTKLDNSEARLLLPNLMTVVCMIIHFHGDKERERALEMIRRVLELRETELEGIPEEDWTELQSVNFARAQTDVAWELIESDRPQESFPYLELSKQIYQRIGNTIRHSLVLINELAFLSTNQRREETRQQGNSALDTMKAELGDTNPLVTLMSSKVAMAWFTIGDVDTALKLMETVLQQREMSLGLATNLTMASQYMVAVYLQNSGNLEKAEKYLREIMARGEHVCDWRPEDIARAKFRLSVVLRAQNRPNEAAEARQQLEPYLAERRLPDKEYTDADDMALLDAGVTVCHGRTAGKWSNGTLW